MIDLKLSKLIQWIARNYDPATIRTILQKESSFSNDYDSIRREKLLKNASNKK